MNYYEKGSYGQGTYDPDEQRTSARDRYLDLLSKQRVNDQAMADRMNRETAKREALMAEEEKKASMQGAGDMSVKGAKLGGNAGWQGAVIGGIIGKGVGAVQHGKKYGAWEGVKAAFNPFSTPKALLGAGGSGTEGSGSAMASQYNENSDAAKRERLSNQLQAQQAMQGDDQKFSSATEKDLDEPSLGQSLDDDPNARPLAQGDLYTDEEFRPTDEEQAYYGRYGRT